MLLEWAHYLSTPAPWAHRRLGYLRESVSLLSRSRRCRRAWAPHLEASRALIGEAIADVPLRRSAIVLGSGLLDDVPLRGLAEAFDSVLLVDAVHPWPSRLQARRHANVRLMTADLSGSAELLLGRSADLLDPLPVLCAGGDVDLVISANLLSQLPILPLDRLASRAGQRLPNPPLDLGRRIVEAHLDALAGLSARVCLITDVEQIETDRDGRITDRLDLLHGVSLPAPDRAWDWDLAPFGEAERDRRLVHRVQAYRNWRPRDAGNDGHRASGRGRS